MMTRAPVKKWWLPNKNKVYLPMTPWHKKTYCDKKVILNRWWVKDSGKRDEDIGGSKRDQKHSAEQSCGNSGGEPGSCRPQCGCVWHMQGFSVLTSSPAIFGGSPVVKNLTEYSPVELNYSQVVLHGKRGSDCGFGNATRTHMDKNNVLQALKGCGFGRLEQKIRCIWSGFDQLQNCPEEGADGFKV